MDNKTRSGATKESRAFKQRCGAIHCTQIDAQYGSSIAFWNNSFPKPTGPSTFWSSPGSHSLLVSDSVGITSSCSLLAFPLSVSLALSCLRCLCFSVSTLYSYLCWTTHSSCTKQPSKLPKSTQVRSHGNNVHDIILHTWEVRMHKDPDVEKAKNLRTLCLPIVTANDQISQAFFV